MSQEKQENNSNTTSNSNTYYPPPPEQLQSPQVMAMDPNQVGGGPILCAHCNQLQQPMFQQIERYSQSANIWGVTMGTICPCFLLMPCCVGSSEVVSSFRLSPSVPATTPRRALRFISYTFF